MIKELLFRRQSPSKASAGQLTALEGDIGVRFPSALVEFCSRWNGGFPKEENCFYHIPGSFHAFHEEYGADGKGVTVDGLFGITDDFPQCSLAREYQKLKKVSATGLIPIAFELLGNHVVLRTDVIDGPVFWRDHELWEAPERPYLIPIADNLELFYNSLTSNPFADV